MNIPKALYLYDEGIKDFSFKRIKEFVRENFGGIKVYAVKLKKKAVERRGLLFDFLATKKAFEALSYAKAVGTCHIILTDKIFATFDQDKRPHIRAAIYGYPSVISTAGIVEGPAKPKEYYFYKQKYMRLGIWEREEVRLKKKFKGRFIDYQDKRINEALKGYIAQGVFFYLTGDPFCPNRNCRLYNAHWQEDLIYSQIKSGKFCHKHREILQEISGSYAIDTFDGAKPRP